jgi:isoleucyl-tRNA synthetase
MATVHRPVDSRASFPALEEAVLARWRERDVFAESLRRREGGPRWTFYEGPPTANGAPGFHHVLARAFKDIFPRHRTMKGHYVERKAGWDCHGLPVELAVEAELGFESKADIEAYGIAAFNQRCRESVMRHIAEFDALTQRIGYWVDLEHPYRTLDGSYIESVWWALKTIHDRGLLFERSKVVPYCPRDQVTLSSHELGQPGAYRDVVDASVYVRLPVLDAPAPLEAGDELVVWTTTPWTLVSNAAVAVNPELAYVRARVGDDVFVVAAELAARVLGEDAEVIASVSGAQLVGARYAPPFDFIPGEAYGEKGHTVLGADFVTASDGSGLVHTALAFGDEDFRLGEREGLTVVNPVRLDGTYDERIGVYAGRKVKECDPDLIEDLRERGILLREQAYEHSYPHCWRCGTALIYYAKPSWYIATSQIKDRLLAANETITWHPEHVKHGRFGNWLENNVDWALSRERYWGTPLPVWRCDDGHVTVIGSLAELESRSGVALEDPHRPFVDDVVFACAECGGEMRRVPEVIDVWFDSGSMPFAQLGAPLRDEAGFTDRFPADYICEALDQTRGWFYSLLAISALLYDRAPYRDVLCLGLINDEHGRKMSKSVGNTVDPWALLGEFGADALRWYLFTSKYPWDGYRFAPEQVGEGVRSFLLTLWNTYSFYVLYANAGQVRGELGVDEGDVNDIDRWILSRLQATIDIVDEQLEGFDATAGGRAIAEFVDDLSNWYVRRSRPRFWSGDLAAFSTLRRCLVEVAQLLAPFCPFIADEIYDNLSGELESVHLCDFPVADPALRDAGLEQAMAVARRTVQMGHAARAQTKLKVRQPLRAAVIVATGAEREAISGLAEIVRDELNVHQLRFVAEADELGEVEVKPNYRTLGPRFGASMPAVAAAVAGLDGPRAVATLRDGGIVAIDVGGAEHVLDLSDLLISMRPLDGYQVQREGMHAVALDVELDDALRSEGVVRDIVRAVQNARQSADFAVTDRITLTLDGDLSLLDAVRTHEAYLAGEVLAVAVAYADLDGTVTPLTIDGRTLKISIAVVDVRARSAGDDEDQPDDREHA